MTVFKHFSALQRAEIAEIILGPIKQDARAHFSALQRAEIAENAGGDAARRGGGNFSALQRAEIAETPEVAGQVIVNRAFQCSSTSRNC